jgi:hypothetical protein
LAQVQALLSGTAPQRNEWTESRVTTEADWARFSEIDLGEARQRLTRLARTFRLVLLGAGPSEWDRDRGENWTLRQIADHVADAWYAEQVGDLSRGLGGR